MNSLLVPLEGSARYLASHMQVAVLLSRLLRCCEDSKHADEDTRQHESSPFVTVRQLPLLGEVKEALSADSTLRKAVRPKTKKTAATLYFRLVPGLPGFRTYPVMSQHTMQFHQELHFHLLRPLLVSWW